MMLAQCVSGKSRYASEDEARKALKDIKKHRTPNRKERHFYMCMDCGGFHLTRNKRKW